MTASRPPLPLGKSRASAYEYALDALISWHEASDSRSPGEERLLEMLRAVRTTGRVPGPEPAPSTGIPRGPVAAEDDDVIEELIGLLNEAAAERDE